MEEVANLKEKTISGLFWRFGERISAQLISFVVSIILARILIPEQYGIVAIVYIFINIASVFVTSGLGTALIQKKDSDQKDFSTMFYASEFLAILFYLIIFLSAPIIASIYKNEQLIIILRVMGIILIFAGFNTIQQAYVQKHMMFKKFFWSTLTGTLISAVVGIFMAYRGFGVWALVAQSLTNSFIDTLVLFLTVKWRPTFEFSWVKFKKLFSYSWKLTVASIIGTFFNEIKAIVIGYKYTSIDLAYANKGEHIPNLFVNNINSTVESVLFSSLTKIQDDKNKVKEATRRIIRTNSFILCPLLFGLSAVAEPLIRILLTDKWIECIPYMRLACLAGCFSILGNVNMQVIKAIGRSDVILKLEFFKKPLYIIIILITMHISPLLLFIGSCIYSIIATLINSFPNRKLLNYTYKEQFQDLFPYLSVACFMEIIVLLVQSIGLNIYLTLVLQIIVGVIVYIGLCLVFRLDSLYYVCNIIRQFFKKYKQEKVETN